MSDEREKTISLFWLLPFHGKSGDSSQDLKAGVRSDEAKEE